MIVLKTKGVKNKDEHSQYQTKCQEPKFKI